MVDVVLIGMLLSAHHLVWIVVAGVALVVVIYGKARVRPDPGQRLGLEGPGRRTPPARLDDDPGLDGRRDLGHGPRLPLRTECAVTRSLTVSRVIRPASPRNGKAPLIRNLAAFYRAAVGAAFVSSTIAKCGLTCRSLG
jgi:hypothetical protein